MAAKWDKKDKTLSVKYIVDIKKLEEKDKNEITNMKKIDPDM